MTKKTEKTVPVFKQYDWCFCEFKLQQIKKMEKNCITEVSDGNFCHGSSDLSDRCYPLEMKYKLISDEVNHWSRKLHELDNNSLNYPDIHRALVERWCEMCDNADDHDKLQDLYNKLANFGNTIINKVRGSRNEYVDGVRIFGR
jgi:hypothetical protein